MADSNISENLIEKNRKKSDGSCAIRESMKGKTLNEDVQQNYCYYFYLVAVVGLVNNTGYVMIGTAAQDLAEIFKKEKLMPLFTFCEILFSSFVRFLNSRYCINIKHIHRLTGVTIVMLSAYLIVAAITIKTFEAGFWISLVCAIMHGTTCAFGESTILGYLKGFPSRLVGAFSTGTGFAGVVGSGIFLVLKPFMRDGFIFLIATPLVIVYFANIVILNRKKSKMAFIEENPDAQERAQSIRKSLKEEDNVNFHSDNNNDVTDEVEGIEIGDDADENIPFNLQNFKLILGKAGWFLFNLSAVYFLEYACTTSFADIYSKRMKHEAEKEGSSWDKNNFFIEDSYIIFVFCYQFGVLISRSSLDLIKVKRVGILTSLQLINFVFWFLNAHFFFFKIYYVMYVWMVFIGLMGGCAYVNVMYLIINSQTLKKREKELAVMICCIFNDIGVLIAATFALVLANTLFDDI